MNARDIRFWIRSAFELAATAVFVTTAWIIFT